MRDPKRIDKFCERLAEAWKNVPDWRFGQLMTNMFGQWYVETSRDPFFPEDDEMIEFIEKYARESSPYTKPEDELVIKNT